ncbi:glycosyl transferase family 90 [Polynucleobacter acidiphobus]|uniref:glycosyl transferase family 90 n=1 Tax=Polynucleobacter acidiphobus TaxID=556053 RepID=UPI0022792487|nr:glycosyl transferase family 90 [Polynucleobacter acidiphobus]
MKLINTFKYLIDVDGNSNAWSSLFLKLLSGSVVLKVESEDGYKQWYYDRLIPWQHYVPVNKDLSDLQEKLDWLRDNDDRAKKLAKLGKDFAFDISFEKELANSLDLIKNNLVIPKAK